MMDVDSQNGSPMRMEGKRRAVLVCWLLGLGSLLTWNSMLTIGDYYYQIFPQYHPSRVLPLLYQPLALGSILVLARYESKIATRWRNIAGYTLFFIGTLLYLVLDLASSGKGGLGAYIGLCIISSAFGVAHALVQGGMVGELFFMLPQFIQSFLAGVAASGALTSALRLITKSAFDKTQDGLRKGAMLFLGISTSFEFLCILLYAYYFPKLPIIKFCRAKAASEGSKTVTADLAAVGIYEADNAIKVEDRMTTKQVLLKNLDYALGIYLIYVLTLSIFPGFLYENTGTHGLGSWYAVVLIAMYNVWDLVGQYTPLINLVRLESRKGLMLTILARFLFIPSFYFTAKYADKGWMMMLTSLLGITNGHLTSCVMTRAPRGYKGPEQNALGNMLVLFLIGGTFSGVALDWLWIIGNGSF